MQTIRKRLFLFLIGGLSLVYAGESLLFTCLLNEVVPWYYPVIGILSDLFWPTALLLCLLFSGWVVFPVLTALTYAVLFFVKTTNLFFFLNLFEILTYSNLSLILAHTDLDSLRLEFGPFYWLKIAGIVLAFVLGIALIAYTGIVYAKKMKSGNVSDSHLLKLFLMILLLLSTCANTVYMLKSEEFGKFFFQRDFSARPVEEQLHDFFHDYGTQAHDEKIEIVFPAGFSPESEKLLKSWGVLPFSRVTGNPVSPGFRKILILAVESLNYEYLRTVNPEMPPDITPCLDRLNREYVSFRNYYTCSQPTSWALDSIFLSRMDFLRDLTMDSVSLCDLLRERKWKTFYFSPTVGMCFNNRRDYSALFRPEYVMFQEQLYEKYGVKGTHYWGIGDDELYDCVCRTLEEQSGNDSVFCVVSTIDLHDPYTVTGPAAEMPSTGNRFLDSLRSTDKNLEIFLDRIMNSPFFDDETLIVVTADHSATFGANYTHRKNFLPDRIPLILITKNNRLNGLFDTERCGSQIDLAPTLLGLLGISVPDTFMGRDLRLPGKNFALTKTVDMIRIHLPENGDYSYLFNRGVPRTKEERALLELYQHFYGVEKQK